MSMSLWMICVQYLSDNLLLFLLLPLECRVEPMSSLIFINRPIEALERLVFKRSNGPLTRVFLCLDGRIRLEIGFSLHGLDRASAFDRTHCSDLWDVLNKLTEPIEELMECYY